MNTLEIIAHEEERQRSQNPAFFAQFAHYVYDDWKPVRQRYDFVNSKAVGSSVLDVACGFYPVTSELPFARKVGIDVSQRAKEKAWKDLHEFYCLDVTQTSVDFLKTYIGTFDTIVASEFLEHLEKPQPTVAKMAALLNLGGRMLITVPSGRSIAGFVDRTRNYVAGNGFSYNRFKMFHRSHKSLLKVNEWREVFETAGLQVEDLDWRPSDIVEGIPEETTPYWKTLTRIAPDYLAHQYFFTLEHETK
jgi:2-polyprenyl-3-methyl-5-hydroxy-6-metoxy-1,4-benzoquinol methylase